MRPWEGGLWETMIYGQRVVLQPRLIRKFKEEEWEEECSREKQQQRVTRSLMGDLGQSCEGG